MNALVAHGGGPTPVLNASLAGLVAGCRNRFRNLFGSRFGFDGLLGGELTDLFAIQDSEWSEIARAPGSAIGSSRRPVDVAQVAETLRKAEIDTLFLTGGNGTMQMAMDLSTLGVRVIGIPKTIDNDLAMTHHCPGYPSAAWFFACAARDIGMDVQALPSPICILETLGRNTGWIAAATALARRDESDAPHIILLPEIRRSLDSIAAEVEQIYRRLGRVVIAVCEGQLDQNGLPFGADVDRPADDRDRLASNLGHSLATGLRARLGLRARSERPGLLGRACAGHVRDRDRAEAWSCGWAAAEAEPGSMVALDAEGVTVLVSLHAVAGVERRLPEEFMDGSDTFLNYLRPLTGEVAAWRALSARKGDG